MAASSSSSGSSDQRRARFDASSSEPSHYGSSNNNSSFDDSFVSATSSVSEITGTDSSMAAAGQYQAADDQSDPSTLTDEEREALAQANMWQEIANQSRQDGGTGAKGALDAADWAISRSLEQKMKSVDDANASCEGPDPKKPRIVEDESMTESV